MGDKKSKGSDKAVDWPYLSSALLLAMAPLSWALYTVIGRLMPAAADALDAEVDKLVDSIIAKPRAAIAMGKELFYRQGETGIEAAYDAAGRTMACNMMDGDALEGVQAFIDKRVPAWRR